MVTRTCHGFINYDIIYDFLIINKMHTCDTGCKSCNCIIAFLKCRYRSMLGWCEIMKMVIVIFIFELFPADACVCCMHFPKLY